MRGKDMVALGRVVLSKRERVIMLQPWDKGVMATTLHYAYEVRDTHEYFDDLPAIYGGLFVANINVPGSDASYVGNVNTLEIPYNRHIGDQPALSADDINDVMMIRNAGLGIAMGNGCEEVRNCAAKIIGHNRDDGLAVFLEELVEAIAANSATTN